MAGVTLRNIDRNIYVTDGPGKGRERNVRQVPPFRGGLMLRPCPALHHGGVNGWRAMVGRSA